MRRWDSKESESRRYDLTEIKVPFKEQKQDGVQWFYI